MNHRIHLLTKVEDPRRHWSWMDFGNEGVNGLRWQQKWRFVPRPFAWSVTRGSSINDLRMREIPSSIQEEGVHQLVHTRRPCWLESLSNQRHWKFKLSKDKLENQKYEEKITDYLMNLSNKENKSNYTMGKCFFLNIELVFRKRIQ